jgi:hypothetical protein
MRGRGWSGQGWAGRGRGNPYPFCRFYPWLPRHGLYLAAARYTGYGYPGYSAYRPTYMPYLWW